jgi:hypothetical protein
MERGSDRSDAPGTERSASATHLQAALLGHAVVQVLLLQPQRALMARKRAAWTAAQQSLPRNAHLELDAEVNASRLDEQRDALGAALE